MKFVAPLLLSMLLGVSLAEGEGPPAVPALDAIVRGAAEFWNVPGVAVAVVQNDRVIYLKGFGLRDVGGKEPVTPDTLFAIGSCTKAFTTTAMAMLVDDGKMSWDDSVRKHVPTFHLSDPLADGDVRLRDLVCHRTGVRGHDFLWYRSPWAAEEIVRKLAFLKLDRPFRTTFQYQTPMFMVAGMAVEAASRSSWSELVKRRIFEPLGMQRACFTTPAALEAEDHATPHRGDGEGAPVPIPWYRFNEPMAAGSICASVRDLAHWVRFQLGDGTWAGKRLVSEKNLLETHTPQIVMNPDSSTRALHPDTQLMSYGMAWVIQDYRGHQLVSHGGAIDGFRAHVTLLPKDRLGLVILCNLHETRMNLALSNNLVDAMLGLPPRDWNRIVSDQTNKDRTALQERLRQREAHRKPNTRPSLELTGYVGSYTEPAYGQARIALERGQLVWHWNSFACPLRHYEDETFQGEDVALGSFLITFTVGARGEVKSMKFTDGLNMEFLRAQKKASP